MPKADTFMTPLYKSAIVLTHLSVAHAHIGWGSERLKYFGFILFKLKSK